MNNIDEIKYFTQLCENKKINEDLDNSVVYCVFYDEHHVGKHLRIIFTTEEEANIFVGNNQSTVDNEGYVIEAIKLGEEVYL